MTKFFQMVLAASLALFVMAGPARAADDNPKALIETVAQQMLKDLEANRAEYRRQPAKLNALVDRVLRPYFDVNEAALKVLGKHKAGATPQQIERFSKAMYTALVQTYASALVDFSADKLQIKPFRGDPAASTAVVQTTVKRSNGTPVSVDYVMRKTPDGWKAWDVKVEGISYVKTFRDDYDAAISKKGLEAFIVELETKGVKTPAAAAK